MNNIPDAIESHDNELIKAIHLYNYHRLPPLASLPKARADLLRRKSKIEEIKYGALYDKNPTGHVMRRVHCAGRGESFGENALMDDVK